MSDHHGPEIEIKAPSLPLADEDKVLSGGQEYGVKTASTQPQRAPGLGEKASSTLRRRTPSDIYLAENPDALTEPKAHFASIGQRPKKNFQSCQTSPGVGNSENLIAPSPRTSTKLEHLLQAVDVELSTYGVKELRDGFFDAPFYRPLGQDRSEMMKQASETLPDSFLGNHSLSLRGFLPQQWHKAVDSIKQISTSRSGIKLLKSFLGVFIAYTICLIPVAREWLGQYNYIMVISAIINHPGRSIGSQIDGALMTILGTAAGLGWGSLALYVSTSTITAKSGYGGVLATFLVIFSAAIAWLRCLFMRFYQAVLCAGIAICYTCLADTSETVGWRKVFNYGVPWVMGQALCLVVAATISPASGSRALSIALHKSIKVIQDGLVLPRQEIPKLSRDLAWNLINLSQAVRDFTIELTISHFHPNDIRSLRNLLQGVLRGIMAIKPNTTLFESFSGEDRVMKNGVHTPVQLNSNIDKGMKALDLATRILRDPTRNLINAMMDTVNCVDTIITLMDASTHFPASTMDSSGFSQVLEILRLRINEFYSADVLLINHPELSHTYTRDPQIVDIFLFVHSVCQVAEKMEAVLVKVMMMQKNDRGWSFHLPSYPWSKSLLRTNAQVRHDRGGLTAGFYFRSKRQLERTMRELCSTAYVPRPQPQSASGIFKPTNRLMPIISKYEEERKTRGGNSDASKRIRFRYRLWEFVHRLQGFESRFAFKVTLITTLVSIPAWLPQSSEWWNTNEIWWTVVTVWIMMHPRVGGTFQDLAVRTSCAAVGAIWAALAFAANDGNPYVMASFAAVFMLPMLYRFTQSSHPRSGFVGCMSFTVVSLSAYTNGGQPSITKIAWTRGLAFIIGVVAAMVVNWVLWPFVARHELRKSLSAMLLHQSLLYRGVIAKYIYYNEGKQPGPEDIARSEMLEGRVREGFVRTRQLLELTQHEIRLRAPFNPLPYSALIEATERFFDHLISVRHSSLHFHPYTLAHAAADSHTLITVRRDAVAVILMNLYVLACALHAEQPVPHYLPSAAAARQRLLDRMELMEVEEENKRLEGEEAEGRRWRDVYRYAFSSSLTDVVGALQAMQRFTKEICGEVGFETDEIAKR